MTKDRSSMMMLSDFALSVFQALDAICVVVIGKGWGSPVHCVGELEMGQRLVELPAVQSALVHSLPGTERISGHGMRAEVAVIDTEAVNIAAGRPPTVIAYAISDAADMDRATALVQALATAKANDSPLLQQAPFLAEALADVEFGVSISNPNLEDNPLVYVDDDFARMTGYTRGEMLGHNCRFLQGHLQDQSGVEAIRNAAARGMDCTTLLTNFRKDGEPFENRVHLRPIYASDGAISHVIGIQHDVTGLQAAMESLDLQKRRYETVIESCARYIWHMNADGTLHWVDPGWLAQAGLPLSDEMPDLAAIRKALEPEAAARFHDCWIQALQTLEPFEVIYGLPADSPSPRWFRDRVAPVRDDTGRPLEWIAVSQEITELKHAEQDLGQIIQAAPTGMLVVDRDGIIKLANAQASLLFGYPAEALLGMAVDALVPESLSYRHEDLRTAYFACPSTRRMGADRNVRGLRQDGTEFDAEVGLSWFGDPHDLQVVAAIVDVTELNDAREAVERAAYQDRLTGLLSREGFARRLDELRAGGGLHPASMVVSVDISGLREINNVQGYEIGDQVLQEAAQRLLAGSGESSLIARSGGGEFLVLAAVDRSHTPSLWRRTLEAVFDAPFKVNGLALFVDAAFGYLRIGKEMARDSLTLINNAELAQRQSRRASSVSWTQYTTVLERQTRSAVATYRDLRQALQREELVLHYQPKVNLASGAVVAGEALLRWQHYKRGMIPPNDFISIAEQSQLIGPIGEWVLRQACRDLKDWRDAGLEVRPMSVNLSLAQFQLGSIPEIVERALTDFEIESDDLILEITESVFEEASDILKTELHRLSAMGVKLSLDDFGTGFSSLGHLRDYPFDEIKIDKTFISQLDDGGYARAIIKAVHAVAEAIGAQVVAEGVESRYHVKVLRDLGCTIGQGFFYSRPLPEDQWRQLLSR